MKKFSLLLLALVGLLCIHTASAQQALENNTAIDFKDNTATLDNTQIKRTISNALLMQFAKSDLQFKSLNNNSLQLQNSAETTQAQFHTLGHSYILTGSAYNFGVNTNAPLAKIDALVTLNMANKWAPSKAGFRITTGAAASSGALIMDPDELYANASLRLGVGKTAISNGLIADPDELYCNNNFSMGAYTGKTINIGHVDSAAAFISRLSVSAAGNVGVGMVAVEKLDVTGNIGATGYLKATSLKTAGGELAVTGNAINFWANSTSTTAGTEFMKIAANGRVGIGLTDYTRLNSAGMGTYKLLVGGGIMAEEVQVEIQARWPDYVFEPSYKLRPLSEVERFIAHNKHLPEMPSEKEVADGGINLGEMNAKLLQKVEELTLYLIEQQKQLDAMKKEINQLKKGK